MGQKRESTSLNPPRPQGPSLKKRLNFFNIRSPSYNNNTTRTKISPR